MKRKRKRRPRSKRRRNDRNGGDLVEYNTREVSRRSHIIGKSTSRFTGPRYSDFNILEFVRRKTKTATFYNTNYNRTRV